MCLYDEGGALEHEEQEMNSHTNIQWLRMGSGSPQHLLDVDANWRLEIVIAYDGAQHGEPGSRPRYGRRSLGQSAKARWSER